MCWQSVAPQASAAAGAAGPAALPTCQLRISQCECNQRLPKIVIPLRNGQDDGTGADKTGDWSTIRGRAHRYGGDGGLGKWAEGQQ